MIALASPDWLQSNAVDVVAGFDVSDQLKNKKRRRLEFFSVKLYFRFSKKDELCPRGLPLPLWSGGLV